MEEGKGVAERRYFKENRRLLRYMFGRKVCANNSRRFASMIMWVGTRCGGDESTFNIAECKSFVNLMPMYMKSILREMEKLGVLISFEFGAETFSVVMNPDHDG